MEHAPAARDQHAGRRVRARRAAGRASHDDPRYLPVSARVVVYHAAGCHLCERALATVRAACAELGAKVEEVDIGGDATLEARYREWLPVVEIDGARAFVYHVDPVALRRKLVAQSPST